MKANIKNKIVYYHIDGLHDMTVGYADHPKTAAYKLLKENYPYLDNTYTVELLNPPGNFKSDILWLEVKNPLWIKKEYLIKLTRI